MDCIAWLYWPGVLPFCIYYVVLEKSVSGKTNATPVPRIQAGQINAERERERVRRETERVRRETERAGDVVSVVVLCVRSVTFPGEVKKTV